MVPFPEDAAACSIGEKLGVDEEATTEEPKCSEEEKKKQKKKKPVVIFLDGVFDLTHFGHTNAFRQARALGDYLIVGVNSDESVAQAKGAMPVLTDEERQCAVAACRFVDEVLPASPYVMSEDYIESLVRDKGVDFFVHGDDPCLVDGRDVYAAVKAANRFRSIPRTEGVSTTVIVGRLLALTTDHHEGPVVEEASSAKPASTGCRGVFASQQPKFLVTSGIMQAFSSALPQQHSRESASGDQRTVYVDGCWDMFHAGHIDLLRRARDFGDRLIVGVHSDAEVNAHRGANHPVLCMHERMLSVLGCRYVDDVLLDAPWLVTREMLTTLGVSVVVRGSTRDCPECFGENTDPLAVPRSMGILQEVESQSRLTIEEIFRRLQLRRADMVDRQAQKQQKEEEWYRRKHVAQ